MRRIEIGRVGRVGALVALMAVSAGPVHAQAPLGEPVNLDKMQRQLEAEREKLHALEQALGEQRRRLDQQLRELDALKARMSGRGAAPGGTAVSVETPQGGASVPVQSAQAAKPAKPVGEAPPEPDRPPEVAQIFAEPTVLTPPGKFVLEPSLQYIRANDNRVALVGFTIVPALTIGLIDIRSVGRDTYYAALTGRWGVANRFELEAKVPYVWATSSTLTRPLATPSVTDTMFDASGAGLGDIEFAARYQINRVRADNPVFIGSLRFKTATGKGPFDVDYVPLTGLQTELATGTGFYGLQAGVSVLFPSDPAVFFGGMNYLYNFGRDVGNGFGHIDPGNILDFNVGMGLALNERASFSVGYQQSMVSKSSQSGEASAAKRLAPASSLVLGTARFGVSYKISAKTLLNFSLGIGVTSDTPDLELTVRVPYTI
ncbi:MAG: acetate kinase [Betaproteobacteria bacterium]|nr:acetate kinase [Betaproteobacteria bacterium]